MPKVSQTKFDHIRIVKSKVIHVQIPVPKWEKTKKSEKKFPKQGNNGIANRGRFYGLQIGTRAILNRCREYKSVQNSLIGFKVALNLHFLSGLFGIIHSSHVCIALSCLLDKAC